MRQPCAESISAATHRGLRQIAAAYIHTEAAAHCWSSEKNQRSYHRYTWEGSNQPVCLALAMQQTAVPGLRVATPAAASHLTAAVLLRRCCRNATNYFGQDCYNNPNSDRGVDYYHYHAALGGWNTSTLNAGLLTHPLLLCDRISIDMHVTFNGSARMAARLQQM